MKGLSPRELRRFRQRLLCWYGKHKRAMPWRGTRDPYRVWLSEVMLQQTRVAAVVGYYERFLARFPTVQALARARSDAVMRLWAGLGYYSRARNLHAAAKAIVAKHDGKFPRRYAEIRALPGIGDYTAAAVSSIAFDEPRAVLDGNVARVLARLFSLRSDLRAPQTWKRLQQIAQTLMPGKAESMARKGMAGASLAMRAPGDWNQAMMELGAMVCTPRSPNCGVCPVAASCRARKLGIVEEVPATRKKREAVDVQLAALVLIDAGKRTFLVRDDNEYFSRMWQFPAAEAGPSSLAAARTLLRGFAATAGERRKKTRSLMALPTVHHTVTFRRIAIFPFLASVGKLFTNHGRWVPFTKLNTLPVSSATRKIAATVAGLQCS